MRIDVSNLSFSYPGGIQALQDIALQIEPGEQVAIIGQNGAGKTTLVKHFNGLLKPTKGTVHIGDLDTSDRSVAELAAQVGYVFQNPDEQLFKRRVADEIAFGPHNLGFPAQRVEALVTSAIHLTDLAPYRDHNPYDLSPAWRKMVALASVIAMDTPIVIFDEPTTGQDAVNLARIAQIVATLRDKGKTVIAISHDIDFCAENFERLIALSAGKVLLDGPVRHVITKEDILSTTYVDPPQLTRLAHGLGIPDAVRDQSEFLAVYRRLRQGDFDQGAIGHSVN